ncbi:hypothetical protein GE21DRAFT_1044239 [Neurospora crassa]|nr:hypothetical protein GE21DRAFT_1044239 [Neurospora crassa]
MFFNAQRCIHLCMPCIPSHTKYPTIETIPPQRAYVVALVVETHADPIPNYNLFADVIRALGPFFFFFFLPSLCLIFFCLAMLILWCIPLRQNSPLTIQKRVRLRSGTSTSRSISGFNSMIPCAKSGSRN